MAKQAGSPRKKAPAMPPESRAAQKKANVARVRQLTKTARFHVAVAKQSAAIAGLSLEDIPGTVKRDMEKRRRAVTDGKLPPPRRLTRADPKATDPHLINPPRLKPFGVKE